MKTRVLDSWAILEWMNGRRPADTFVAALLAEGEAGKARLLMSAINVSEVYCFLQKRHSAALADSWRESSGTFPVTIEVPTLDDIWQAASLQGLFPISYAGAFAAALSQKHNCALVTGDPEFRSVDKLKLDWIGRG